MKSIKLIWFSLLFIICSNLNAQSPYEFSWKKDGGLVALGGISTGLGLYTRTKLQLLTAPELAALNRQDVNAFDRFATNNYSPSADNTSDVFWAGTHILPFLFLTNKKDLQALYRFANKLVTFSNNSSCGLCRRHYQYIVDVYMRRS